MNNRQSLPTVALFCLTVIFPLGVAAGKTTKSTEQNPAEQGTALTLDGIIQLHKAGIPENVLITKIKQANKPFNLSVDDILKLNEAKVPHQVIQAMMDPSSVPTEKRAAEPSPSATPTTAPGATGTAVPDLPNEIGVYIKKDDRWAEIQPEIVNWKTGGMLKSIASAGIVKGDLNGLINGAHSRNAAKTPLQFIVVAPEGVAITEYQLIRLREKKDTREFRTVTGGVLHASTGATRDLLQYEGTKVASRTFSINLPTLGAGEYGFLPPGAMAGSGGAGAARLGKMYTFRVGE